MTESQRYFVIPESTFANWFVLGPSNDPCTVKKYEIFSKLDPLTPFPDSQVQLIGTLGSYKLLIDKTIA